MADNKINMSLDDIIKKERKGQKAPGKRTFPSKKPFVVRRTVKGGRMTMRRPLNNRGQPRIATRGQQQQSVVSGSATMKLVNKLVKKAISERVNQSLITRAAMSRRRPVVSSTIASRPAVFRGRVRRGAMVGSRLEGRLGGVSQRSKVIVRSPARRARPQRPIVLQKPIEQVRGRGISRIGSLVSDSVPVMYEEREVVPLVRGQMVRRIAPRVQQRLQPRQREVIVERRAPVVQRVRKNVRVVVPQRDSYIQPTSRGIRKRVIVQQPRYVVVNSQRDQPPRRQQRVQEVYEPAEPRTRFVRVGRGGGRQFEGRQNVINMREALGIGRPPARFQTAAARFEPSSSFLQRVPTSNRRGRGFKQQSVMYD